MELLGAQFLARKQELLNDIEENGLPAPETRSFTGHVLTQGEPVQVQNS